MPRYTLSVSEEADINLHRLASELGIKEVDVLRNAINTYATLKRLSSNGYVFVQAVPDPTSRDTQRLVVKKVALP
jgi:hypothetical protein